MPDAHKKQVQLEIAHVLFIDVVGYSTLSLDRQQRTIEQLNDVVRQCPQFHKSDGAGDLLKIPTGDGMALVFQDSLQAPAQLAVELAQSLKAMSHLPVRMGIHSGPVSGLVDLAGHFNVAGAGINLAQRVMDCGDAGHILLSKRAADDLAEYDKWRPRLHQLGKCKVKHAVELELVNFYDDEIGNRAVPTRVRAARSRRRGLVVAAAITAAIAAAIVSWLGLSHGQKPAGIASDKSIAVLPFENLSGDPENAYFATGIQDEILTRLAKVGALRVISHRSTEPYAAKPGNLPEIARQLGVTNILEGSVQRAGDQVHINTQLIRAATDEHLWAESYDRKLESVFSVEAEVATAVAEALKAKLTGAEQQAIERKPTDNPEAYGAYLRGIARWRNVDTVKRLEATHDFEEAVRLDSQFVDAWARLARANALACRFNATADARQEAEKSLASAIRVGGNQPEVQVAQGFYQYWVVRDYESARKTFESVRAKMPNNPDLPEALYLATNTLGRWEEAGRWTQASIALNPLDPLLRLEDAYVHHSVRDYAGAIQAYDDALKVWPNDNSLIAGEAGVYQALGDLDRADQLLGRLNLDVYIWGIGTICDQAKLRRQYGDAVSLLEKYKKELVEFTSRSSGARTYSQIILGDMERLAGDSAAAQRTYSDVRQELEELLARQPWSADWICNQLSEIFAGLGDREQALTFAQRAYDRVSEMGNANGALGYEEVRARIESRFGMADAAMPRLERLLKADYGYPITAALLRLDPDFDAIRSDPRFQKLAHSDGR